MCERPRVDTLDLQMNVSGALGVKYILLCRCCTAALQCSVEHVYVRYKVVMNSLPRIRCRVTSCLPEGVMCLFTDSLFQ
jgi:hypothetical protein